LRLLKERFPHVKDSIIIQKYRKVFQELAFGAKNREFLPLLAKRYAGEELEREYPTPKPVFEKPKEEPAEQKPVKRKFGMKMSVFFKKFLGAGSLAEPQV